MWRCDECGKQIPKAQDGWVEWLASAASGKGSAKGLRLVHKEGCQYGARRPSGFIVSDDSLENFLGADGLMLLLELLYRDELPRDEVTEMIKRLHVPNYEEARPFLRAAVADEVIEPNLAPGHFWQEELKRVAAWGKGRP